MRLHKLCIWTLLYFISIVHPSENRVTMAHSEGLGFYTSGDYTVSTAAQSIGWISGAGFGVELNRNRFEYNDDGGASFMVFKVDHAAYDFSLLKSWQFGAYFSLGTRGGVSYLKGKTEESVVNFSATPAEYADLELILNRFSSGVYTSTRPGHYGYRLHAFPAEPNGTAHVTITELRNRTFYGFTASISPSVHYKSLRFSILPGVHWYPDAIIYKMAIGLGLDVPL